VCVACLRAPTTKKNDTDMKPQTNTRHSTAFAHTHTHIHKQTDRWTDRTRTRHLLEKVYTSAFAEVGKTNALSHTHTHTQTWRKEETLARLQRSTRTRARAQTNLVQRGNTSAFRLQRSTHTRAHTHTHTPGAKRGQQGVCEGRHMRARTLTQTLTHLVQSGDTSAFAEVN